MYAINQWLRPYKARVKGRVRSLLRAIGYDDRHWARSVMYDRIADLLRTLGPANIDALEISAGTFFQMQGFRSLTAANYPEFDICKDVLDRQFDMIIADQVFEHLLKPYHAARNVHAMLKPGGHFLITTPFLYKIHLFPTDCTRWTETGMKYFLMECGFPEDGIMTDSWGNRACVRANFRERGVPSRGWFGSRRNEPNFPIVVWALARKAE